MRSDSKNADKKFRMHAVTRRCGKNGCRPCGIFYAADIIEAEDPGESSGTFSLN